MIPLGCLHVKSLQWYLKNTADILSLGISHYLFLCLWFTGIIFSGGQIFQFEGGLTTPSEGAKSPFLYRCSLWLGCSLEASNSQWSVESGNVVSYKRIQKSASKSRSVDFHRQFFSGCLYEQAGRQPLSGNLCLNLKSHGLDECQGIQIQAKCIPGNLNVLTDFMSKETG